MYYFCFKIFNTSACLLPEFLKSLGIRVAYKCWISVYIFLPLHFYMKKNFYYFSFKFLFCVFIKLCYLFFLGCCQTVKFLPFFNLKIMTNSFQQHSGITSFPFYFKMQIFIENNSTLSLLQPKYFSKNIFNKTQSAWGTNI